MASAADVKDVKSLLECSLCLSTFQQPKCLPCVHSFCQDCLQRYADEDDSSNDLPCPVCRQMFSVPPQGVSGLPNNFFIQNLIDLERKSGRESEEKQVEVKCDACMNEGNVDSPLAVKFCLDCNENLCEACVTYHGKCKATKAHALILLSDRMEDSVRILENSVRMCEVHNTEPLRAYCLKCDVCICTTCMLSEHNEHRYEEIKDAALRFTQKFNEDLTKLSEAVPRGHSSIKELLAVEQKVIKESSDTEEKIRVKCDELRKLVDHLEEELLGEVSKFKEQRVKEIKSIIDMNEFQNLQLEGIIRYLRELKDKGSSYDIACSGSTLSTRAEEVLKSWTNTGTGEQKRVHMEFLTSNEAAESALKGLIGELVTGGKHLMMIGLDTGPSVEQNICHISLDKPDSVKVINSTPAKVEFESAACVVSNDLYSVGIGIARNELWKWSASRDEWTRCADLPSGRSSHGVTAVENKIYVLGGWDDADETTLDSILSYDINSNTWTEAGKLPQAVMCSGCVTYKHCVYVFGGLNKYYRFVSQVQIYDTSTDGVSLSSIPIPQAHGHMRAVLWRSKALLVGDITSFVYDLESNTWLERERFKTNVLHFSLTLDDNTLFISGGGTCSDYGWTCRDDVKSLSVDDFMSGNEEAEWRHYATLPAPGLVEAYSNKSLIERIE